MADKYFNTLKMMGVSGRDALEISDMFNTYHISVNQNIKQKQLDHFMSIKVVGKTFKEWMILYTSTSTEKSQVVFTPLEITLSQLKGLVELTLQEHYKKVKILK